MLQELDDLLHLLLRLVDARDVRERHLALAVVVPVHEPGARLADAEDAVAAADPAREEPIHEDEHPDEEERLHDERRDGVLLLLHQDLHVPREEVLHDLLVLAGDERDAVPGACLAAVLAGLLRPHLAGEEGRELVAVKETDHRFDNPAFV